MNLNKLFFLAFIAVAAAPSASAQTSYPLVCRGGGGTLGNDGQNKIGMFYFQKSPASAGAGLTPGQCSWVDRAIGATEPTCLKQYGVSVASWIFPGQLANSYHNSTNAPWLRSLLNAGTFQTFQVYNPGNTDCFVVTRLGP